jgi:hypothetical protein
MMELWLSVTNDKVQYIAAQEGFKASISHTHRLYAEGLLDQKVFSNTGWGMWFAKTNPPPDSPEIAGVSGTQVCNVDWGEERSHVEQEYDAFIRQLNNMGLPRMVRIYQGIYDRYMGK